MASFQRSPYLLVASFKMVWCYIISKFLPYPLLSVCVFICVQNLVVTRLVTLGPLPCFPHFSSGFPSFFIIFLCFLVRLLSFVHPCFSMHWLWCFDALFLVWFAIFLFVFSAWCQLGGADGGQMAKTHMSSVSVCEFWQLTKSGLWWPSREDEVLFSFLKNMDPSVLHIFFLLFIAFWFLLLGSVRIN